MPAAVQAVAEVQDTPFKDRWGPPGGLRVGWIVQLVPFQRSASVTWFPALLT